MTTVLYISLTLILMALFLGLILRKVLKLKPSNEVPLFTLPSEKNIVIDDFKISYWQDGSGPHITLIHGLGASKYIWRYVFNSLSKNFTVTALDLPGFGSSSKLQNKSYKLDEQTERLLSFLNQMNIKETILVGSSMGGTISLWFAKLYPKRVTKVVALAPATNAKIMKIKPMMFFKFADFISNIFIKQIIVNMVSKLVHYDRSLITTNDLITYYRPYKDNPESFKTFLMATQLLDDSRLPNEFKSFQSPLTIVWGEKDFLVPKKFIKQLLEILPNSKLITLPKTGHHPMEERPEEIVKIILQ